MASVLSLVRTQIFFGVRPVLGSEVYDLLLAVSCADLMGVQQVPRVYATRRGGLEAAAGASVCYSIISSVWAVRVSLCASPGAPGF